MALEDEHAAIGLRQHLAEVEEQKLLLVDIRLHPTTKRPAKLLPPLRRGFTSHEQYEAPDDSC